MTGIFILISVAASITNQGLMINDCSFLLWSNQFFTGAENIFKPFPCISSFPSALCRADIFPE
jgi:hypothetical protein